MEPPDDNENNNIADEAFTGPSHANAFNALETAMSLPEKQPDCSTTQFCY